MDRRVAGSNRFGKRSDVDAVIVLLPPLPLLLCHACELLLLECLDGKAAGGESRLKDAADGGEDVCDEIPVDERKERTELGLATTKSIQSQPLLLRKSPRNPDDHRHAIENKTQGEYSRQAIYQKNSSSAG